MAKEIERKFLVDAALWNWQGKPVKMAQAYLCIDETKVIRVRIADDRAFMTIKSKLTGISRDEFEYEIAVNDARQLLDLKVGALVEKTRYLLEVYGKLWEIDVFEGANKGLIVAEIELNDENESFQKPDWALEEVSTDVRYYNFKLSVNPYSAWQ
ncbi:MAG: CYTH domain-containing protein [Prolixibacteraceae bacterium]|nr:CYTH domain-containing protein [Prolixibacteraceae bacterium]